MRDETRRVLEQHPNLSVVGEAEDGLEALELSNYTRSCTNILNGSAWHQ
jgi:DNA-binding NarL/FixJ family response regulator